MTEVQNSGVSRRRIIQGAAWATPAILIASAAPSAATVSGGAVTDITALHTASSGNLDTISVFIPANMTISNLVIHVAWTHNGSGESLSISGGGTGWTASGTLLNRTFTADGSVSGATTISLHFAKGTHATVTVGDYTPTWEVFNASI